MVRYPLVVILILHTLTGSAQPSKRLYISNDDHTDYMWAGNESQYADAFIKMLDYYVAQSDETASLPSAYQSRFNCDGNFWLWEYEKHKTPAEFQKLIDKIRSGYISVPYNALASCYGATPTEGILRGMYYAGYLERKYNLDLDLAVAMEDQTLPLGLSSLWAGSGARYSWKGVCDCDSKLTDMNKRSNEIYWYKGLDDSAILMKWYALAPGGNKELGGYAEARNPVLAVDQLSTRCNSQRYPYNIAGAFGYGWDDLQTTTELFTLTAQQKSDSGREVIVSNHSDFFKDFEATYGKAIPSETISYGNEWDLYSASMSELSAQVRRAVEKLRSAEAMASLISLKKTDFAIGLTDMRRKAWMALGIYYEHDWTSDGPISKKDRATWQRKVAAQLTTYVDSLYHLSKTELGHFIKKTGGSKRYFAFNPLGWKRTDVCDLPHGGSGDVRVLDIATGREVASQRINVDGKTYVRILAVDIPALGYKVYEVVAGKPAPLAPAALNTGSIFANDLYSLSFTSQGAITSLIDKKNSNVEYAAKINGRYINDLGSQGEGEGMVTLENAGPVSVTILCTGRNPLKHESRITLFKTIPRVDIQNRITENFGDVRSWAFSYNIPRPEIWHEELGAVLNAKPITEGGHYANRNARFDWLTLNHFADVSDGNHGITLSNADCAFMKSGNSLLTRLDTETPQISVLAGGQVDEGLGIAKQDGDSLFTQRFALNTHLVFEPAAAMRFSLEHQNPLVADVVEGNESVFPEKEYSFLRISDPNVLLWSLKPAEDGAGAGIIARVWNFGAADSNLKISFEPGIAGAYRVTHVETDLGSAHVAGGELVEPVGRHQIKTFRIQLRNPK